MDAVNPFFSVAAPYCLEASCKPIEQNLDFMQVVNTSCKLPQSDTQTLRRQQLMYTANGLLTDKNDKDIGQNMIVQNKG